MSPEVCKNPVVATTELDFRPELLARHFELLIDAGYPCGEAQEKICGVGEVELTYAFLERYLQAGLVHFSYRFEGDSLVSPKYEHLGDIADRYKAAIFERQSRNKPAWREEAELEGFVKLKETLRNAADFKTFVIFSPPPAENELIYWPGYANYSFYYLGKYNPEDKKIDMFAWRNHKALSVQKDEANRLLGRQVFGKDIHPNDFLRSPVVIDGGDFEALRFGIRDLPDANEIEKAKNADWSKYKGKIRELAKMLTALIADGANEAILHKAHLQIEMEFTRLVLGEMGQFKVIDSKYFAPERHYEFASEVMANFAVFAQKYKGQLARFACGSCGSSVFSTFSLGSGSSLPLFLRLSMPELLGSKFCPNCGEKLTLSAEKCDSCKMTKSEYDAKQAKAA